MTSPGPTAPSSSRRMRLRYAGTCRVCAADLPAGVAAVYERDSRTVRCLSHDVAVNPSVAVVDTEVVAATEAPPVDVGDPGASARREFERRRRNREERVRSAHPRLGGLLLAISDDPQSTRAWDTGATGEESLGRRLNELAAASPNALRLLHDRRVPGTRANIDHLAVTATGVWVIDAKKYAGRPSLQIEGGLFRARTEKLLVGRRDRTALVDGMHRQVEVVTGVLPAPDGVAVHGVLCFVEADWPLIGGCFTTRGVRVLWPKRLFPQLLAEGPLGTAEIEQLHRLLADALPPA